jgi:transcriptional regulator with XRE-family HTH domain
MRGVPAEVVARDSLQFAVYNRLSRKCDFQRRTLLPPTAENAIMATGKGKTPSSKAKAPAAAKPTRRTTAKKSAAGAETEASPSLFGQLLGYTEMVTGGLREVARAGSAIPLMYTDNWLKELYSKAVSPERLHAMADAGAFLRDARQVAGLNLQELASALGLSDTELLEEVEKGRATLPFDMLLRTAALIARHDPIPFILNFVRTYNPELEKRLDSWGITALPKQFERERRFVNLMRKHDVLRDMSDAEFDRFIRYQGSAIELTLEVMQSEKSANRSKPRTPKQ